MIYSFTVVDNHARVLTDNRVQINFAILDVERVYVTVSFLKVESGRACVTVVPCSNSRSNTSLHIITIIIIIMAVLSA